MVGQIKGFVLTTIAGTVGYGVLFGTSLELVPGRWLHQAWNATLLADFLCWASFFSASVAVGWLKWTPRLNWGCIVGSCCFIPFGMAHIFLLRMDRDVATYETEIGILAILLIPLAAAFGLRVGQRQDASGNDEGDA